MRKKITRRGLHVKVIGAVTYVTYSEQVSKDKEEVQILFLSFFNGHTYQDERKYHFFQLFITSAAAFYLCCRLISDLHCIIIHVIVNGLNGTTE